MVANKYAFLQITRRRFLNEWEAFKKVISRRNIRRRITIPLTLSNLKLLRRITRTENILHRNFTRRQVAILDECSRLLEASTMKSRRGFAIQRLMNAMRQAHADGWFIVFDTLTLADDRLEAFYDNPNALRDYFRDIGRMVLAAEGRKANDSHADCYQYFCVPEYGTANGRLHFHAVHFMRTLPTGSVDPNFGRRVRNRRQLNSLQNTWPYGYSMPIAVRYTQDAFSRSGWLWPVDAKGEPLKATSYMAVGFYVAKYVNKKSDMDLAAKGLGAKEWNNSLKTKLSLLPKKLFRIRMSRNFGMKMLTMTNLSTECLIQLTKLGYDATPFNQILKQNAKREMRLRLGKVTVADVLAAQPVTTNLLKFMRASIKMIGVSNLPSLIASRTQKLTLSDISDESKNYLDKAGIGTAGSAGMPRPISYAVFCLKKKISSQCFFNITGFRVFRSPACQFFAS